MRLFLLLVFITTFTLQVNAQYLPPSIGLPGGGGISPRAHQLKAEARQQKNESRQTSPPSPSPAQASPKEKREDSLPLSSVNQAASNGSAEQLRIELEKHPGAITRQDSEGYAPLHYACRAGNVEAIKELLRQGANPNSQSTRGETALYLAALHNQAESIKALLLAGADANLSEREKQTPLHIAAKKGNLGAVKALLEGGADSSLTDNRGRMALDLAQIYNSGPDTARIVSEIIKAKDKR